MSSKEKTKLPLRHCRFCGLVFQPKRSNQKHCCAQHRVNDAVRRFWAKHKKDYHIKLNVKNSGKCAFCGKPHLFNSLSAKYCSENCAISAKKTRRSD